MSNKKKKVLVSILLVILLLLLITSSAFAAGTTENDSDKEDSGGITVWETFFMLLTVIPVSKMLSSIFMKLVARVGTVDEDKWAMIGLGAIGATIGLMRKGGTTALGKGGFGGFSGASDGGGSGGSRGSGGGYTGSPGSTQPSVQPGSVEANTTSQPSNIPGVSLTSFPPSSNTSNTGNTANATAGQTGNQSTQSAQQNNDIPEVGQRSLNDILKISGQAGSKAAGIMAKAGAASAFAVPEVAPVTAGIYAATAKGIAGTTSAAGHLAREVLARNKQNNQSWGKSLMQITGTNNMATAVTKAGTAIALSPFGSRISGWGTGILDRGFQKTGDTVQRVRNKI
ncbi:MAG: hypothetical protein AB1341_08160 [Bacillota bacterium]